MVVMNFFQFVITISLQITCIISKKYDISSDESIENILFYKDYRPKKKEPAPLPPVEPLALPSRPKQPECIPRMCCSMSCTDSCGANEMSNRLNQNINSMNPMNQMNQMNPMNSMNSMMSMPMQSSRMIPPFNQHKNKLPSLPFPSRRTGFGSTREHIKSLISKDEDIKKILRDLVRVTMKKVDLLEMIKARRASQNRNDGLINDDDEKGL